MTESEARQLLADALASNDTPTIMDAFDRLDANGFEWLIDGLVYGFG